MFTGETENPYPRERGRAMALGPFDVNFVEKRKGHMVIAGAELFYFFIRARVPASKLVAGKRGPQNPLVLVFFDRSPPGLCIAASARTWKQRSQ